MKSIWVWPFELKEKIGEGGMGLVYKARYVKDDRLFAVKLIPADSNNKTLIARFELEIATLKELRHPNIVRSFGGVCEDKQRFYAMELVEGGTLWDKIQSHGQLPWMKVVEWGRQMCAGLAYAHDKQVVHRDVKPNNFLLTKAGQVKLSDFGLVSVMSEAKLTADGRTLGTVQYMSPEQIRGKPKLTHRSDIYSLGCVFYEMLTGHSPFEGDNPAVILQAHLKKTPASICAVNRDCPVVLEQLVFDMLAKDPEDRPATATIVSERLLQLKESPRLVESSSSQIKMKKKQLPPQSHKSSLYSNVEKSLRWAWGSLTAVLFILAVIWALTLFKPDPGVELWIAIARHHQEEIVQVAAVRSLGELAGRQDSLLDELMDIAESTETKPQVAVAALEMIAFHHQSANRFRSRITKISKNHPSTAVRQQAMTTFNALKASE
ncbi:MAG: serine/threonine protein kinase [Planctomycetaceae bacterium]|nr:serine/threonine protein kinase [Planctomycetaceae bacterium]MBL4886543.1 serine/threonine protein kinase [Planctomycetaceae bacterium]